MRKESVVLDDSPAEVSEEQRKKLILASQDAIAKVAMLAFEFVKLAKFVGPHAARRKRREGLMGEADLAFAKVRRTFEEVGDYGAPQHPD